MAASSKKKQSKPTKAEQSRRFIETAWEIGVDESGEAFEHAFRKIVPAKGSNEKGLIKG